MLFEHDPAWLNARCQVCVGHGRISARWLMVTKGLKRGCQFIASVAVPRLTDTQDTIGVHSLFFTLAPMFSMDRVVSRFLK